MISYERIDYSESIDFGKGENSVKCMICNYFYFSIGFKYPPYFCNACRDISMSVQNLSDLFILSIKNVDYRVYISGADKKKLLFLF